MGRAVPRDTLAAYVGHSPFHAFLGVRLVRAERGRVEIAMPYRPEFAGDPELPFVHGGILASLLDVTACCAVVAELERDVPTIDLRVDYLRPAPLEELLARGRVIRVGRTLGVADAEVLDSAQRVLAVGRGLFSTRE